MHLLLESHQYFLSLLLKHDVDFILIGGYAVIYYGYERGTADMDLWLKPDNENREKLISVFREYGIREEDIKKLQSLDFNAVQAFHTGKKPFKIDFLTKIAGVNYNEADREKVFLPVKEMRIPVIHYRHLLKNKAQSTRLKDKADAEELQKINRYRKKFPEAE